MREILEFCQSEQAWLLETIETLVRLESPSTDKAAVDRCGRELESRLAAMGGRVQRLPRETRGDHLLVEFGCGARQLLLLGHLDTVWPVGQLARMPYSRTGGRLSGPGIFDMKAGIALAMLAVRALWETGSQPSCRVTMLWTSDEEIGSPSSRAAIEDEARRSEAVFVMEPALPGGAVKTMRKGCGTFRLDVRGVASHAGIAPERGASAIHEIARQVVALEALQTGEPGASVSVGTIAGGTRVNVVADEAHAEIDVRAETLAAAQRLETAVRSLRPHLPGTSIQVTGGFDRPPLERTAAVVALYELARAVAGDLGRGLDEGSTGGGSDGNFTAACGVPTLDGLGAVGDGAHALHEHVEVDALVWRAALVAGLLLRVAAQYDVKRRSGHPT